MWKSAGVTPFERVVPVVFCSFCCFLSINKGDICMSFLRNFLWIRQILRAEIKKKAFDDGKCHNFFITLHL